MKKSLKLKDREIILIGTAHISKQSAEEVKEIIEKENPDLVAVELDRARYEQLLHEKWHEIEVESLIKEGKLYLFLLTTYLSNMQKRMGLAIGVKPGSEFLQAIQIAQEKKIPVVLADQSSDITLKKAFASISLTEKIKLLASFVYSFFAPKEQLTQETIESMKNQDFINKVLSDLAIQYPNLKKTLVDERDIFIANRILSVPSKKTVAVIGAGHLNGIEEYLRNPQPLKPFVQKKSLFTKILKFLIPILFILALATTFSLKGFDATISFLLAWFFLNGIFSALGAMLAQSHPYAVLAAFFASPFTSISPFIAAGWVAALIELKYNKPIVQDFENLRNLSSFNSFFKNRVTKAMLVAAFVNIGSTIGTVLSFAYLATLLA